MFAARVTSGLAPDHQPYGQTAAEISLLQTDAPAWSIRRRVGVENVRRARWCSRSAAGRPGVRLTRVPGTSAGRRCGWDAGSGCRWGGATEAGRSATACALEQLPGTGGRPLKDLLDVLDVPPLLDARMLELTRWLADLLRVPGGRLAPTPSVPAGVQEGAGTRLVDLPDRSRRDATGDPTRLDSRQAGRGAGAPEALDRAADRRRRLPPGAVHDRRRSRGLRSRGLVHTVRSRLRPAAPLREEHGREPPAAALVLTAEQRHALDMHDLSRSTGDAFAAFLLHGVTGSGKTEVYLQRDRGGASRAAARRSCWCPRSASRRRPIRRFRARFTDVAVLHSHLSDAERHRHWQRIAARRGPGRRRRPLGRLRPDAAAWA